MYHEFNKKYFGNRLPKDMVVKFKRMPANHGITMMFEKRPLYVLLDFGMRGLHRSAMLTLLHEMVHIEHPSFSHGPLFHKRMLQLAKVGAFRRWW